MSSMPRGYTGSYTRQSHIPEGEQELTNVVDRSTSESLINASASPGGVPIGDKAALAAFMQRQRSVVIVPDKPTEDIPPEPSMACCCFGGLSKKKKKKKGGYAELNG